MNGRFLRLAAVAALGSAALFGNTVTVKVTSISVTPFTGLLNNSATLFTCDDDHDQVTAGESWQATETSLNTIISDIGSPNNGAVPGVYFGQKVVGTTHVSTTLYEEAAWLVYQFGTSSTINTAIQQAIWDIMDQVTGLSTSNNNTTANYWFYAAQNQIGSNGQYKTGALSTAQIADLIVLTPAGFTPGQTGAPQEFFAVVPEPATYALYGFGLILLSLASFRRTRKSN